MSTFVPFVTVVLLSVFLFVPHSVLASVAINEILFDPAGTDTGLEKIELYNPDAVAVDMSNWELYPDGIGYFVFPSGFSLASQSFAVVHLRMTGTNPAGSGTASLYHASASSNMGNSSGSLALFKPGGRSKDTLVDFVRYHKTGASERKTWESAAADAGLWTSGEFVDIAAIGEGSSIGLSADGARRSAGAWKIFTSASIGSPNSPGAPLPLPAPAPPATTTPPFDASRAPVPSLGASAGADATAVAGAVVPFRGLAFGLDGEVLETARFVWNFGDGSVAQGKALTHIYHFPGTYHVNLLVSSGEYTGSDWRVVTVVPPALAVSEVKPGADGFVELANAASVALDISGMNLTDERGHTFWVPAGTVIGAESVIVFANATSGLDPARSLTLRDARRVTLAEETFSGLLPSSASWERVGDSATFAIQPAPTPGKFTPTVVGQEKAVAAPAPSVSPSTEAKHAADTKSQTNGQARELTSALAAISSPVVATASSAGTENQNQNILPFHFSFSNMLFAASLLLGIAAAAVFIAAKRFLA